VNIATADPPEFLKLLSESGNIGVSFKVALRKGQETADARHPVRLLSISSNRPYCCRAGEEREELAAFHSSLSTLG
jgi:hypothetical protein